MSARHTDWVLMEKERPQSPCSSDHYRDRSPSLPRSDEREREREEPESLDRSRDEDRVDEFDRSFDDRVLVDRVRVDRLEELSDRSNVGLRSLDERFHSRVEVRGVVRSSRLVRGVD